MELPLLLWQGRTGETRVIARSRILPTLTVSSAGFLGIGWNSILHSCKAGAASCRPHPKQPEKTARLADSSSRSHCFYFRHGESWHDIPTEKKARKVVV